MTWQSFFVGLKKNQGIWNENQIRTELSSSIFNESLDKIVKKEKITQKSPNIEQPHKLIESLNKNDRWFLFDAEETSLNYKQKNVRFSELFQSAKINKNLLAHPEIIIW